MNEARNTILALLFKVPLSIFSAAILAIVIIAETMTIQASTGPSYEVIAGSSVLLIVSLIGVIFTMVMRKISEVEAKLEKRVEQVEQGSRKTFEILELEVTKQAGALEVQIKEAARALSDQLEADRQIRMRQHKQNTLAWVRAIMALKTGDFSHLEPEKILGESDIE